MNNDLAKSHPWKIFVPCNMNTNHLVLGTVFCCQRAGCFRARCTKSWETMRPTISMRSGERVTNRTVVPPSRNIDQASRRYTPWATRAHAKQIIFNVTRCGSYPAAHGDLGAHSSALVIVAHCCPQHPSRVFEAPEFSPVKWLAISREFQCEHAVGLVASSGS